MGSRPTSKFCHFNKAQAIELTIKLVAGAGFEPTTFGL